MSAPDHRSSHAPAPAPVPTSRRTKIVISAVLLLLVALLAWGFFAHRESDEREEAAAKPASRIVAAGDDEAAVELDAGTERRAGIVTVVLAAPGRGRGARGVGAVPDSMPRNAILGAPTIELSGEIVVDPARVSTIRAAVPGRLMSQRWPVLGERVAAGRVLAQVSDAKPLVAPRSGTVTRVTAQPGELVQAGQELLVLADLTRSLVRVVWRPDALASAPPTVTVSPLRGAGSAAPSSAADLVGAAGEVDTLSRAPVYYYGLRGTWAGAAPGLPVTVSFPGVARAPGQRAGGGPAGAAGPAVIVPTDAVVQWEALAWAYVLRGERKYVRVRVMTDRPVPGGYLVTSDFVPGQRVVVRGAQQLLSEEFRTKTQMKEDND